jgi:type IV secretory pathway VirB10-like protein
MADSTQQPESSRPSESSVRNQAQKPTGILPKHAQTLVIAGLSVVMVAAIAISGNSSSKGKTPASQPRQAPVIDPSAARINEYRNRLEEETRKLSAEQAALSQAKQAAGLDPRLAATAPVQSPDPSSGYPVPQQAPVDDKLIARKQLEAEKERKEYASLFASNVALSYRQDHPTHDPAAAVPQDRPTLPVTAFPYLYQVPPTAPPSNTGATQGAVPGPGGPNQNAGHAPLGATPLAIEQSPPNQTEPEAALQHGKPDPELTRADGKSYRLLEGTILGTVLTNRLTGALAGPVNTMVTADVYSHDRQHLLIPQGSRVLGEVKAVNSLGQQRLAVLFHRIIMPDGYSASLDRFQGLNQIGETGLRDQVNHHYLQVFGVSIAIGAIAGLSQANTQVGLSTSGSDAYRQGVATSLSQSALRILDRYLNILPTFTIREGHRIKVYLANDLPLPAYDRHTISPDF